MQIWDGCEKNGIQLGRDDCRGPDFGGFGIYLVALILMGAYLPMFDYMGHLK